MRHATVALSAASVLIALLGPVSAAPAQPPDPGVIYEPGTPSGKEYAIPLEEARREATGGGAGVLIGPGGRSGGPAPPVGIGINTPAESRLLARGGTAGVAAAGRDALPQLAGREQIASAAGADVGVPARVVLPVLLVLLPGLLAGLALARRARTERVALT